MNSKYKYRTFNLFIVIILSSIISLIYIHFAHPVEQRQAIELIENGEYAEAADLLCPIDNGKNIRALYYYAEYLYYKEQGDVGWAHLMIDNIPETYHGKFAKEIEVERGISQKAYDEYWEQQQEEERLFAERIKTGYPEVGMKVKYIDDSILGKHDGIRTYKEGNWTYKEYYWRGEDSYDIAYGVSFLGNIAVKIEKSKDYDIYRSSDGEVSFKRKTNSTANSKTTKTTQYPNNEYNVYDYHDPEDFYEDYGDEFYDYEDAEEYFDDAWD